MKTLITSITLCCMIQILPAQTTSTWTGGTPGRTTDWNYPGNWREGRVPDENAQVIIPADRQYYPVISGEVNAIDALLVAGGAQLTIRRDGVLTIEGNTGRLNVLTNYGDIINEGVLTGIHMMQEELPFKKAIDGQGELHFTFNGRMPDILQH